MKPSREHGQNYFSTCPEFAFAQHKIDNFGISYNMYIMQNLSVADARQHLSEILGKVAYGGQTFLITKKGRPMAQLVPLSRSKPSRKKPKHLGEIKGGLEDDDPFFVHIESIRAAQRAEKPHRPRSFLCHK